MRGWVAAAGICVALGASAGLAVELPSSDKALTEAEVLRAQLAEREAALEAVQQRLRAVDDAHVYEEAQRLGVAAAVEQSGLPAGQQRRLAVAIVREARRNGLDPMLVVAVIRCESSFNNYAVSNVGAMGLMQVMPDTGAWLATKAGFKLGRATNLFDGELNVQIGTAYLADLIARFGSVEKALVAYNAGPGLARKILAKREIRTKFLAGYPHKVVREFEKLKARQQHELSLRDAKPTVGNPG